MNDKAVQPEIDDLLNFPDSYENDDNMLLPNLGNNHLFEWDFKSENSKELKDKLLNKFNTLLNNFPSIFSKSTGKQIKGNSVQVKEYSNLATIQDTFNYYKSDFYIRKLNVENEELIEYISPDFVNKILLESSTDQDNFIKKTLANHFIIDTLEKELSKLCNGTFTSQDMRLKNPTHIPYTDPLNQKSIEFNHNLNLTSGNISNLISVEFEFQYNENKGLIILAGTKNAWFKLLDEKEVPQFVNTNDMKNHNIYSVFTSINISEEQIENMEPGDTFIGINYDKYTKIPLIHKGKIIAQGELTVNKEDKTGILIKTLNKEDEEADYYENSTDNLFIIFGSTYSDKADNNTLEKNNVIMFNTTITGLFPVMYKNKIIAQADIVNYYGYPLIKIIKLEENPIFFSK